MRNVVTKEVKIKNKNGIGVEISWNDGQCVLIIADKGLLACGAIDSKVMEKFNFAAAIARGTPEKPLRKIEDLLNAKVVDVTLKAKSFGIKEGMNGSEVLEKLV